MTKNAFKMVYLTMLQSIYPPLIEPVFSSGQLSDKDQYVQTLRLCISQKVMLHEKAMKHFEFLRMNAGVAALGFADVLQSWSHIHGRMGRKPEHQGVAVLKRYLTFSLQISDDAVFGWADFELVFWAMLLAVDPPLLMTNTRDNEAHPVSTPAAVPAHEGHSLQWFHACGQRFLLERFIGAGAFGSVFKAIEIESGRRVAIKRIARNMHQDTLSEFGLLSSLKNPNLLHAIEHFTAGDHTYIVTEFISGGSLAQHLAAASPLGEPWVAVVFKQVFSAMSYCHANDIVHNDLKPDNLLLANPDGDYPRVVVSDFGQASVDMQHVNSRTRLPCGDPRYSPPEAWGGLQYRGLGSKPCDLWMLGASLFEVLSGGIIPFLPTSPISCNEFRRCMAAPDFLKTWLVPLKTATLNSEVIDVVSGRRSLQAHALLRSMLEKDPRSRLCIASACVDSWFGSQCQPQRNRAQAIVSDVRQRILSAAIESSCVRRIPLDPERPPRGMISDVTWAHEDNVSSAQATHDAFSNLEGNVPDLQQQRVEAETAQSGQSQQQQLQQQQEQRQQSGLPLQPDEEKPSGSQALRQSQPRNYKSGSWSKYVDPETHRLWYHNSDTEECFFADSPDPWVLYKDEGGRKWWWNSITDMSFYDL
eukprot:TRINITY_DN9658_c0_g2_i1.p1 TRINITY_DN9658_c0_g2~~TRINITY_DN9658_c0_g2_i1.p1  ORF type:complete len:738 (+),score=76.42 TRINITY_DN9658_c0_g2_i1:288-2216(+)